MKFVYTTLQIQRVQSSTFLSKSKSYCNALSKKWKRLFDEFYIYRNKTKTRKTVLDSVYNKYNVPADIQSMIHVAIHPSDMRYYISNYKFTKSNKYYRNNEAKVLFLADKVFPAYQLFGSLFDQDKLQAHSIVNVKGLIVPEFIVITDAGASAGDILFLGAPQNKVLT